MVNIYAPSTIDLSRLPAPEAVQEVDYPALISQFKARFLTEWQDRRVIDPTLPEFTEIDLETHPIVATARTWAYLRGLDRQRVNDAFRALLSAYAKGSNLDAVAASRNIQRLVVVPATATTAAIMETDDAFLRRYLLSFDRAAAGSHDRYLYEAWSAWPMMLDARINGFDVHGRRGDTDVVIIGPGGRLPTEAERLAVRAAVTAKHVKPDAVSIAVLAATRHVYNVSLRISVPSGPDPELVRLEAVSRVRASADARMLISGEVPVGLIAGAAYGASVIAVEDLAPVSIAPDPYSAPVLEQISITVEVRT